MYIGKPRQMKNSLTATRKHQQEMLKSFFPCTFLPISIIFFFQTSIFTLVLKPKHNSALFIFLFYKIIVI